jgi:CRISPR/Cas system-associated exonuclease Cas4 (RecB family)
MRDTKQTRFRQSDVINASEIGQYYFCPVAWYLQRKGYKPESPMLDIGTKKHVELGRVIDRATKNAKKSRVFALVGYLLLAIAVLILLFEVIL